MKLISKTFYSILVLLLLTTLVGVTSRVNAQEGGLSMTPVDTEIRAKQGDVINQSFSLTNTYSTQLGFVVTFGEVVDNAVKEIPDSESYLQADVRNFVLLSGETQTINFSFTVPSTLVDGFYAPVVIVKSTSESTGAAVSAALGHRINLFVSGSGQYQAALDLYKFSYSDDNAFDNTIAIDVAYVNSGVYPTKVLGRFQIVDDNGNVVFQRVINEALLYLSKDKTFEETFLYDFNILDTLNSSHKTAELQLTDAYTGKTQVFRIDLNTQNKSLYILIAGGIGLLVLVLAASTSAKKRKRKSNT